ncbi:folate-binding protein [Amphritea sp. 1_MG-2023]|uniref:CAF17-like 4Fe-4S cluster assembly/insertion protein YgfZ n=1 Tax=Amphritea sp. 1_MG-2023 TaxID=3062670 RepID=UPI0026E1CDC4|nr:folate-binding protein [Amphritea sp. 1_MG-2023]MDO6564836.1 folate-binding protein [Amphritea sp. 1_MG-2023]
MSWLDTLHTLGVQIDERGNCQVSASKHTDTTVTITPLTHLGLFDVLGPDAEKFLQGQLSCDISQVSAGKSLLGAHCNIKGSMVSLSRLIAVDNGFWLRCERSILATAMANLKKYMVFSKAESQDRSDEIVGLGFNAEAAELLAAQGFSIPIETGASSNGLNGHLIRVPGDRFELWLPAEDAITLLTACLNEVVLTDTNHWRLAEIRAGIPALHSQTIETFIPQMTNLQVFDGVSFTKGCYTGQEVVTRLQHRGKLNRPMYRLAFSGDHPPVAGSAINTPERAGVGSVVSAAMQSTQGGELLAVILKSSVDDEQTSLMLEGFDQPLQRLELPYTLDPELFERKTH